MRPGEISEDQIECLICHRQMRHIATHLPVHGLTVEEYKERFPGAVLCSQSIVRERALAQTGVPMSEEACANLSKAKTGQKYKPRSPEHCRKLSEWQKGVPKSEEHKKNLSDAANKFNASPEGEVRHAEHSQFMKEYLEAHPDERENFIAAGRDNVKWRDTEPELQMRAILNGLGLECEPQGRIAELGGVHSRHAWDFTLREVKVAIECDGCFFHLCPVCALPVRNEEMLESLIENERRALERDTEADLSGWVVLRFWGHELAERPEEIAGCVMEVVSRQRRMVA